MSRFAKLALGFTVTLLAVLLINAVTTGNGTREAEVTVADGKILQLSRGALQVVDSGEPPGPDGGQPIVLLHCYTCSLHYFDRLVPLLAANHRVISIDLLGHGGSEAPESGYEIPEQAAVVAEALNELGVEGAMVVGNSIGGTVTASLAEQASQLVDRAVLIGSAPNVDDYGDGLPFVAELGYAPVIGEALWRIAPDSVVRGGTDDSFSPGFDTAEGFEDPDQPVEDFRRLTYAAYDSASAAAESFTNESSLADRFAATPVPLLVIFGAEDQIFDAERALEGFGAVPGVQTELVPEAGHTPQVEKPEEIAVLLEGFALDVTEPAATPNPRVRQKSKRDEQKSKPRKRKR